MHLRNFGGGSACSHAVSDAEFCADHANVSASDLFWMMNRGEKINRRGCRFAQESDNADLSSDNYPRVASGHHGGR
jgi:hypothetical protein